VNPGDPCEVKLAAGLGGWRGGATILARSPGKRTSYEVNVGGVMHVLPESRVRPAPQRERVSGVTEKRQPDRPVREWARDGSREEHAARLQVAREIIPKSKPARSQSYLDFVRSKRCCSLGCSAGAPSEAHHYGPHGTGTKTSDYRTVPVCRACHQSFHDTGTLPCCDAAETRARFHEVQVALLVEWLERRQDPTL
jgi:hypothetical protein